MDLSSLLQSLGGGIQGVAGGLGSALYPTDPATQGYVDPSTAAAARNKSLISLGLGIMSAPYSRNGLGAGLLGAYQGSQNDYQGAMDTAFKNTLVRHSADWQNKQQDREIKLQGQQDRQTAATTASRVATGLQGAADPGAYWNLVGNSPDVKGALEQLGIQAPYTGPMADPNQMKNFQQQLSTAGNIENGPPAPIKLSAGETIIDPVTKQPIMTAPVKSTVEWKDVGDKLVPVNSVTGEDIPGLAPKPKTQTPYQAAHLNISSGNLADWTPEALDFASEKLYRTGVAPGNLGKGSPVLAQLYSMAAAKAKANGQDATAALYGQSAYKAGSQALGALTKQQNTIGAFEQTASKNMDLALSLSDSVDRTGSPLVNRAIMNWKQNVTGDPDTAAFVNALTAARTEYAKVLSGATGATGVTDSARKEAEELFSKVTSKETLQKVMAVAKQEMTNRMSSFDEQQARLKDSMTQGAPKPPAAAASGAPAGADGKPLW